MNRIRVGIEIGAHTVKVVWVGSSRTQPAQWHFDQKPRLSSDSLEDVARNLRQLLYPLRRLRYESQVVMAAPQSHLRVLKLSVSSTDQIPKALQDRLPSLFPFEAQRRHVRYRLLSKRPVNGALECTIQAAACDVQHLQEQVQILWQAGWIPTHIYSTAEALVALAQTQDWFEQDPTLLFELGARHSTLAIVAQRHLLFARELALGSNSLTEVLMTQVVVSDEQMLKLSWEQAEALKCQVGLPEDDAAISLLEGRLPVATYRAMLQPVLEQWLGEIQRTIAFCVQSHPEVEPQQLLLCGGGSQLAGFDRWLSRHSGLAVKRLTVHSLLGQDLPAYSPTCGLLLAEEASTVNLLPQSSRVIHRWIRFERIAIQGLCLVLLGLWLVIGTTLWQQSQYQRQLAQWQQRWKVLEPMTSVANTVTEQTQVVHQLSETEESLSAEWLKRLARKFPSPVRLRKLSIYPEGIEMNAEAQTREESPEGYVSEMAMWLAKDRFCEDVRLGSSQRSGNDTGLVNFTLTCQSKSRKVPHL